MGTKIKLMASTTPDGNARLNRTANILGALGIALSDRIASEVGQLQGMSASAVSALIQVHFYPGLSVEQLKSQIGLSHSASVRVVDLLENGGHVERKRITARDARVISLYLTPKGDALVHQMLDLRNSITRNLVAGLPLTDQLHLERIVYDLISRLVRPGPEQELVCRFCDLAACPQDECPMTLMDDVAAGAAEAEERGS